MDIAVKGKGLIGSRPENNNWVMMTYYFDRAYTNNDPDFASFLPPLRHMRPMGVQFGFAANQSMVFDGARTNSQPGFLSGPADSAKVSCLSCHATAGTSAPLIPGIDNYGKAWSKHTIEGIDYSLSLGHALDLYYTRPRDNQR
jgi:hypothetical protein